MSSPHRIRILGLSVLAISVSFDSILNPKNSFPPPSPRLRMPQEAALHCSRNLPGKPLLDYTSFVARQRLRSRSTVAERIAPFLGRKYGVASYTGSFVEAFSG